MDISKESKFIDEVRGIIERRDTHRNPQVADEERVRDIRKALEKFWPTPKTPVEHVRELTY